MTEEAKEKEEVVDDASVAEKEALVSDIDKAIGGVLDDQKDQKLETEREEAIARGEEPPEPEEKEEVVEEEEEAEGEEEADGKKDLPAEKKAEEAGAEKKVDEDDSDITDEHLTRAVNAGLSISDAKSFKDAKALDNVVSILEAKAKVDNGDDGKGDSDVQTPEQILASIPELDPEEYDESFIAIVNALKGAVSSQQETIKGLSASSKEQNGDYFEGKVSALSEDMTTALKDQPEKLAALKSKFELMSSAYKAGGAEVDQGVVFQEAVSIVLSDEAAATKTQVTKEKLATRKKQHTNRPEGSKPAAKKNSDVFKDIAGEIDEKMSKMR